MKSIRAISLFLVIVMLFSVLLASCGGAEAGRYNDAKALYEAGKYEEAQTAFEAIKDYEDSKDWIKKCKTAILDGMYNDAIAKLDAGNIIEAYEALIALDGHKDSADKAASIADQYKAAKLKNAKAGDIITFGRYEQDNDPDNGVEDIEWIVLEVKDGKALLVSKFILDYYKFGAAWANSVMRTWLNTTFYEAAFDTEERNVISESVLKQEQSDKYSVYPGVNTDVNVFVLSADEAEVYFENNKKCEMTPFSKSQSAQPNAETNYGEWWLRSLHSNQKYHYLVNENGGVVSSGVYGRIEKGVRPAMWIEIGA